MQRFFLLIITASFFLNLPTVRAGGKNVDLELRKRIAAKTGAGEIYKFEVQLQKWSPQKTAIIVCDMWDSHHCYNAVQRVVEIAPRMNEVLEKSRTMGMLIIHAPSSCMEPYKDHPARKNAKDAPPAKNLPKDISVWCNMIPSEEKGKYPIDQTERRPRCRSRSSKKWHKRGP